MGVKHHQRNKTNNLRDILLMLSIRFDNISVFIVEYKEFAEKNGSTKIELYNIYTNAV
jgi:hypothetical protein